MALPEQSVQANEIVQARIMGKSSDGVYREVTFDRSGRAVPGWVFGKPLLRSANNGSAAWDRVNDLSQWQKGTGWQAKLYGGVQTGDDWGAAFVPVNEMKLTDITSALWSYYMTGAQTMGVNMVIWVRDPTNFSKRAEISQLANVAGLGKAAGWNSHVLNLATTQFFFYGENTTGTDLTAGTNYKLSEFQNDALFKDWTIYRISFEYGWEASGTFDKVWLVEAIVNGINIPFIPEEIIDINLPIPFEVRPVSGNLTSDGVQWAAPTTSTGTASAVSTVSIGSFTQSIGDGKIQGKDSAAVVEFGLTFGIKSSQGTPNGTVKMQVRNSGGTWVDLFNYATPYALAVTELEKTYSGYFPTVDNWNRSNFDLQMLFYSDNATSLAIARVKNSSYIKGEFMPRT